MKKLLVCLLLLLTKVGWGQFDPNFTQYMFNEMFINPAYTGSKEALSLNTLHRFQWTGLEGAPRTSTFTAQTPILLKKAGVGFGLVNESIGVSKRTSFQLNGAYKISFEEKGTLSFGLKAGLVTISENWSDITTLNPNDVQFNIGNKMFAAPNFGFGTYYYTDKWFAGLSIPRLMKNAVDGSVQRVKNSFKPTDFHYYLVGGYVHKFNSQFYLKPMAMVKAVPGAPMQADLSVVSYYIEKYWGGIGYRSKDAMYLIVGFQIMPQLMCSYSYDLSINNLAKYHGGSHELQLSYIFHYKGKKVDSPRLF